MQAQRGTTIDEDDPLGSDMMDWDPKKVVDLEMRKRGSFDFAKIGAAVEDLSSVSTAATADVGGSIAFSCANESVGMDSWQSGGFSRSLQHQGSGSSLSGDRRLGHQGSGRLGHQASGLRLGHQGTALLEAVEESPMGASESLAERESEERLHEASMNQEPIKVTSVASPGLFPPGLLLSQALPSVGSKDHSAGTCKPCAWFHKPDSCQNGKECLHCHLCPDGEIKSRKKSKTNQIIKLVGLRVEPAFVKQSLDDDDKDKQGQPPTGPGKGVIPGLDDPAYKDALPSEGARLHVTGECRPCAWFWKTQGCANGRECKHCHLCPEGELKNRKKKNNAKDTETAEGPAAEGEVSPRLPPPPGLAPVTAEGLPSVGSAKHATYECRPCAWFWKKSGCSNGKECQHCHLCSESEIKRRKKAKLENIRSGSKDVSGEQEDEATSNDESQRATASSPKSKLKPRSDSRGRGKSSTPPPPPLQEAARVTAHIPYEEGNTATENEDEYLSVGSQLHKLGKCKPCAWHWKPGGCTNGKECCHCHVCPKEELKGRRKAKENAMRAGALEPSYSPHNRMAYPLKIFNLL